MPSTQEAAESLLATLGAGRVAVLSLAADHLAFAQLRTITAAFGDETSRLAETQVAIDRRIGVFRSRLSRPPMEATQDDKTPAEAKVVPVEDARAGASRLQRAMNRADLLGPRVDAPSRPPERRGLASARTLAPAADEVVSAPAVEPAPEVSAAPPAPAPSPPSPTPTAAPPEEPMESPRLLDEAPAEEPTLRLPEGVDEVAPPAAPAAEEPEATAPESVGEPAEEADVEPVEDLAVPAALDQPEPTIPARAPAAPRAVAAVRVAGANEEEEEEEAEVSAPATVNVRAVAPMGVRASGASMDEDLASDDEAGDGDEDDESMGIGIAAGQGGIRLRGAVPSRDNRGDGPRLTDEDETPSAVTQAPAVASIRPAGEDGRITQLMDEALVAAGKGDLHRAIQSFTDVLDLRHDRTEAYIGRGRCYLELGDYSSAMSDFQRAEDLQPDRPDAHVAMGDLYFARKEYRRAIEFYDQAVELDGSHAMARCRRGISHYYRKNYRQAFQDLQRAYSLDPEIPNIRKYVQMAVKKMERGD